MEDVTGDVSDVRHRKRGLRFEKSQLVEIETWAKPDEFVRYGRRTWGWGGGRWKSQHRKNVYFSPYVEKSLNSKVIKSFVPELRSRKCFFVFQDSYVISMCVMDIMNVLRIGMNMSISRILVCLFNSMSSFFCTLLNSFKYFYLTQIFLFNINYLFELLNSFKYC